MNDKLVGILTLIMQGLGSAATLTPSIIAAVEALKAAFKDSGQKIDVQIVNMLTGAVKVADRTETLSQEWLKDNL